MIKKHRNENQKMTLVVSERASNQDAMVEPGAVQNTRSLIQAESPRQRMKHRSLDVVSMVIAKLILPGRHTRRILGIFTGGGGVGGGAGVGRSFPSSPSHLSALLHLLVRAVDGWNKTG
ncbi:uncharacterized protein V6R79_007137 [Siganus canaliculatus]